MACMCICRYLYIPAHRTGTGSTVFLKTLFICSVRCFCKWLFWMSQMLSRHSYDSPLAFSVYCFLCLFRFPHAYKLAIQFFTIVYSYSLHLTVAIAVSASYTLYLLPTYQYAAIYQNGGECCKNAKYSITIDHRDQGERRPWPGDRYKADETQRPAGKHLFWSSAIFKSAYWTSEGDRAPSDLVFLQAGRDSYNIGDEDLNGSLIGDFRLKNCLSIFFVDENSRLTLNTILAAIFKQSMVVRFIF